jgi:FAD/FMN-containing dehydrogenase
MTTQMKSPTDTQTALRAIAAAAGEKGWTDDPETMAPHLEDWRSFYSGEAAMLLRPRTTQQVSDILRLANEANIPVVPQGGNTSMCGASVPNRDGTAIILSLENMKSVRTIDLDNNTMTVEAGCVLQVLQQTASDADRFFPLSLGAEGSCMIGGNLSTNAGGTNVLRYGNARDLVLGLEVVLPDGRIWDGLRGLRKDNTGYDLKHLFVGAEGTLGIITAAVLKLFPKPRALYSAYCAVRDVPAAIELLNRSRSESGDAVITFELMSRFMMQLVLDHIPGSSDPLETVYQDYVLMELVTTSNEDTGLGERLEVLLGRAMEDGLVLDAAIAQNEAQRQSFWRLRENATEAQKLAGASIKHDISVPISKIPEFCITAEAAARKVDPDIRVICFGHVGDGNLHYNLMQPEGSDGAAFMGRWEEFNRAVHDVVVNLGGSISAEHGIGQLKRDELRHYKSDLEMELMDRIKTALDPNGIMNPGKVL